MYFKVAKRHTVHNLEVTAQRPKDERTLGGDVKIRYEIDYRATQVLSTFVYS